MVMFTKGSEQKCRRRGVRVSASKHGSGLPGLRQASGDSDRIYIHWEGPHHI